MRAIEDFKWRRLSDRLITPNNVVLETITVAGYEIGQVFATRAGEMLYGEKLAPLYRTSAEEEAAGFAYLRNKEYSAVDCFSFAVMERLGIQEALALDSDSGHPFVIWPGPQT